MTTSPLTDKTILTANCSSRNGHSVSRITPHYMAWYTDGSTCAESFLPSSRQASANYCIGKDGDIVCNVLEEYRAWTSSSSYNDRMAITIECANFMDNANGHVMGELPEATWKSLVALCADVCERYGFRLEFTGDDSGNLTMHKWYGSTDCPGPWFSNQFDRLAAEVNAILDGTSPDYKPKNNTRGGELDVDGIGGYNTILDLQHYLGTFEDGSIWGQYYNNRKFIPNIVNVKYDGGGSPCVAKLQQLVGCDADGYWGRGTSAALQMYLLEKHYVIGPDGVDGYFGPNSVKALQEFLNDSI